MTFGLKDDSRPGSHVSSGRMILSPVFLGPADYLDDPQTRRDGLTDRGLALEGHGRRGFNFTCRKDR
jgi:hypothetical protein